MQDKSVLENHSFAATVTLHIMCISVHITTSWTDLTI